MQRIERYGVIALVFLIVTIVAVSFWGDGVRGAPWARWFGAPKDAQLAEAAAPRRSPDAAARATRRSLGADLPLSTPQMREQAAPFEPLGGPPQPQPIVAGAQAPQASAPLASEPPSEPYAASAGTLAQLDAQQPAPLHVQGGPYALGAGGGRNARGRANAQQASTPPAGAQLQPIAGPAASGPRTYVVAKGDSLSTIASRELGSAKRWTEIQALNGGLDPKRLAVGMKILLPAQGGALVQAAPTQAPSTPTAAAAPAQAAPAPQVASARPAPRASSAASTYVVAAGDTLSQIAARTLGASARWREIAELNPRVDPARLLVGTRLLLPGDALAGARATQPSPAVARAEPAPERGSADASRPRVR